MIDTARRYRQQLLPAMRDLALDLGLVAGHEDYTRFIILGRSRTGSNLLRGLLNSHPGAVVFGELFQSRESIGWGFADYRQTGRQVALFQRNPVAFVQSEIFRKFPTQVAAVGFKLFYYHAQDDDWRTLWTYLSDDKALHVIHIKRANLLRTHLSRKRAAVTDRWVNVDGRAERYAPISLDYAECLADFVQTRAWESEYDELFAAHPRLTVWYEALSADTDAEVQRIQTHLRLPIEAVIPETYRQANQPLSASIANFQELKQRFSGTEWEAFFEE
jgi:LPS sulfotransferase NodH